MSVAVTRPALPLPPEKIDEVRGKADLVEVARGTTALRKQGHNFIGCCPFHQERTPSFSVHPGKQLFYCFGCQRGGDVFAFVMQTSGVDFTTAVRQLAEQVHVDLEPLSPAQAAQRAAQKAIFAANEATQALLFAALWQKSGDAVQAAAPVHAYLKERGIESATARNFGLGFGGAPRALAKQLTERSITAPALAQAGLVNEGAKEPFLAGRLTFPIYDLSRGLTGFGARRLDAPTPAPGHPSRGPAHTRSVSQGSPGSQDGGDVPQARVPKYLNSREGPCFHKGEQLFGLPQAANTIRHRKEVLLVEGYMDVLALHQAGASHAVAALGTQLTDAHAALLKRIAGTATLLLDSDRAGITASFRASQKLLRAGLQVQLVMLPKGEDPASVANTRGSRALLQALASPEPAVASFVRRAFAPERATTIERRVAAAQALMPLIDSLQSGLEKTLYISRVAQHVGVSVEVLQQHWRSVAKKKPSKASAAAEQPLRGASRSSQPGPGPGSLQDWPQGQLNQEASGGQRFGSRQGLLQPGDPGDPGEPGADDDDDASEPSQRPAPQVPASRAELLMVRELLLFPELFCQLAEVVPFVTAPQLQELLQNLAKRENDGSDLQVFLTQCIKLPRERALLAEVRPFVGKTPDEGHVRANRTFADILHRLRLRSVDDALRRVLGELAAAEGRGDATDALVCRKQQLTAEKRALRSKTREP